MKSISISILILLLSLPVLAKPKLSDERLFFLYEQSLGPRDGKSCSGLIAELDGKYYGFTNAHCMDSVGDCNKLNLIRNYSDVKGAEALLASNWTEWTSELIEKGTFVNHSCKSLKLVNRHMDLAIFEISEPTNIKLKNNELPSFSVLNFEEYKNFTDSPVSIFGHPEGAPLIEMTCLKKQDKYAILNGFRFNHTCATESGMSGGAVLSSKTRQVVGLNSAGSMGRGSGPDLSFLKPVLIDYLRGNENVGLVGKFQDEYITLDGLVTIISLELNSSKKGVQHSAFLQKVRKLHSEQKQIIEFPLDIIVDDRIKLGVLAGEHPFDFLKVPADIEEVELLSRVKALMEAGDTFEYKGQL